MGQTLDYFPSSPLPTLDLALKPPHYYQDHLKPSSNHPTLSRENAHCVELELWRGVSHVLYEAGHVWQTMRDAPEPSVGRQHNLPLPNESHHFVCAYREGCTAQ